MDRIVHSRAAKTADIEVHVSTVTSDSGTFGEVREYVVSLQQYGRGTTFPLTPEMGAAMRTGAKALFQASAAQ